MFMPDQSVSTIGPQEEKKEAGKSSKESVENEGGPKEENKNSFMNSLDNIQLGLEQEKLI